MPPIQRRWPVPHRTPIYPGSADIYFKVCPTGCQYTSIQEAVYAAKPNDIIEIESGTYNGNVFLTKDLTFRGVDTGSGEPKVTGNLYYNNYKFSVKGFGFESAVDPWPYLDYAEENSIDYWIAQGDDQSNSKSYADAVESYNKALKMDPRNPYILIQKAVALGGSGRFEESWM
jgi:pectin methylesterase-like acyl-CoA thioesterase